MLSHTVNTPSTSLRACACVRACVRQAPAQRHALTGANTPPRGFVTATQPTQKALRARAPVLTPRAYAVRLAPLQRLEARVRGVHVAQQQTARGRVGHGAARHDDEEARGERMWRCCARAAARAAPARTLAAGTPSWRAPWRRGRAAPPRRPRRPAAEAAHALQNAGAQQTEERRGCRDCHFFPAARRGAHTHRAACAYTHAT
jgi:hypothetical protein